MQGLDCDKTPKHETYNYAPASPYRAINARSICASLKCRIDELIDIIREGDQNNAPGSLREQEHPNVDELEQILPRLEDTSSIPAATVEQKHLLPPVIKVKQRLSRSFMIPKKFGHRVEDSWARRVNQRINHSQGRMESTVAPEDHETIVRMQREFQGNELGSLVREPYLPPTRLSRLGFSNLPTTLLGVGHLPTDHLDIWNEGQEQKLENQPKTDDVVKSYFDSSSESEVGTMRRHIYKRGASKMKTHMLTWLRESFILDEEEKAFFEARRSMMVDELLAEQHVPMFVDGRRVR